MLQRIQSIFLLLTSGSFFSLFALNFASSDKATNGVFADQIYNIMDSPFLIGLTALGGGIALITIFLFKNRPLQIKLGYLLIGLSIVLPLLAALLRYIEGSQNSSNLDIDFGLGIYVPIVALISAILANRFIKKDNKLVKSMDRLR